MRHRTRIYYTEEHKPHRLAARPLGQRECNTEKVDGPKPLSRKAYVPLPVLSIIGATASRKSSRCRLNMALTLPCLEQPGKKEPGSAGCYASNSSSPA